MVGDSGGRSLHGQEVGLPVGAGGRPHADEHDRRRVHRLCRRIGESQSARAQLSRQCLVESGLVEGRDRPLEE